tara:strand:- start:292 stop:399 length:108 start_codon:yes stop_codon:yes gene_type:complete
MVKNFSSKLSGQIGEKDLEVFINNWDLILKKINEI